MALNNISTQGATMGNRILTELEKKVVMKFFTIEDPSILETDDIRVYCRRDSLPMAIWPFLIGGYSRSVEPLAVRWLIAIQQADDSNYERNLEALCDESNNPEIVSAIYGRVERFLQTWAVKYGHNSLKDSALDCFAIENVSQRATKAIEDSALAAYQEKSTRYMDFSKPSFYFECADEHLASLYARSMDLYERVNKYVYPIYEKQLADVEFVSEVARKNTIVAKCFDVARYLLPVGIKTSLGITCSTRETEKLIQRMAAGELPEVQTVAMLMQQHGSKINPGLLKHVECNHYAVRRKRMTDAEASEFGFADSEIDAIKNTNLVHVNVEDTRHNLMLALSYTSSPLAANQILHNILEKHHTDDMTQLTLLIDRALAGRGKFDELPVEFKQGQLVFEIVLDFGAFRDLQRHRVGTQIIHGFAPHDGWSTPDVIDEKYLRNDYNKLMSDYVAYAKSSDCAFVDYCMTMAHMVRYLYICDIRQLFYMIELRTGPSGHWSYRHVCQKMAKDFLELFPEFKPYLRVDWSDTSDRSKSENVTAAKLGNTVNKCHAKEHTYCRE